jgi:hypothetical protein
MRLGLWLLLLAFLVSCLGLSCSGSDDAQPTQTTPLPSKTDRSNLPKREPQRR